MNVVLPDWAGRNMIGVVPTTPLWRVFRYERLLETFKNKANVLVKPRLWEDPFENLLGRSLARIEYAKVTVSLSGLYDAYYGQCWTHAEDETDATWRIYAPGLQRGVRVRVRAGPLIASTIEAGDLHASLRSFLGKVEYLSQEKMLDIFVASGANMAFDPSAKLQAGALLMKREAFAHEAEVRLLYSTIDSKVAVSDVRPFRCEPADLIEDILLDPRLTKNEVNAWTSELQAAGARCSITQSTLYQPPTLPVISVPF